MAHNIVVISSIHKRPSGYVLRFDLSLFLPPPNSSTPVGKNVTMPLASGGSLSVTLDSVLSGHEDWVYSVAWRPPVRRTINGDEKTTALMQPMELLSTSMDRTTVLWAPVEESETMSGEGLWTSRARMGEMGVCIGEKELASNENTNSTHTPFTGKYSWLLWCCLEPNRRAHSCARLYRCDALVAS